MKRTLVIVLIAVAIGSYFTFFDQKSEKVENKEVKPVVAHLIKIQNKVSYKANREFKWDSASENMNLFKFDSIQTQEEAKASVAFLSQSELSLNEKTLIIIDPAMINNKSETIDRAVLKNGYLVAKTAQEMWILTKNGLVKLKKSKKGAEGHLQLEDANTKGTRLQLISGEVDIIGSEKLENKTVEINKEIYLQETHKVDLEDQKQIEKIFKEVAEKPVVAEPVAIEKPIEKKKEAPTANQVKTIEKPIFKMSLTEPKNLTREEVFETNQKTIQIAGVVEGDLAEILFNGKKIEIKGKNQFSQPFEVKLGPQILIIQAFNKEGVVLTRKLVIIGHE